MVGVLGWSDAFRQILAATELFRYKETLKCVSMKADILENAPVLIALHDPEQIGLIKRLSVLILNSSLARSAGLSHNCSVDVAYKSGTTAEGEMSPEKQPFWPKDYGLPLKDE